MRSVLLVMCPRSGHSWSWPQRRRWKFVASYFILFDDASSASISASLIWSSKVPVSRRNHLSSVSEHPAFNFDRSYSIITRCKSQSMILPEIQSMSSKNRKRCLSSDKQEVRRFEPSALPQIIKEWAICSVTNNAIYEPRALYEIYECHLFSLDELLWSLRFVAGNLLNLLLIVELSSQCRRIGPNPFRSHPGKKCNQLEAKKSHEL